MTYLNVHVTEESGGVHVWNSLKCVHGRQLHRISVQYQTEKKSSEFSFEIFELCCDVNVFCTTEVECVQKSNSLLC